MSVIIHHTSCPCCNSLNINEVMVTHDFSVTKELFSIWQCNNCTVRFTQNIPDIASITPYYKSSAYISHTDTKSGMINKVYHIVRNITLQSKKKLILKETNLNKGSLLDVGAGTGAFINTMQHAGWQINGLEPDETASNIALQKFGLKFQQPNHIYQLPDNAFDAITLWHVLEHVHDLSGYMQNFARLLKPEGKLFIAVPNYKSSDAEIYNKYWAAYDVPRHLYHFSAKSMNLLATKYGFVIKAYKPMWFDSFYVSMLSEKYKNGRENYLLAILNGFYSNLKTILNIKHCSSIIYVLSKTN